MVSEMSSAGGESAASLQHTFKYLLGLSIISFVSLSSLFANQRLMRHIRVTMCNL